MKRTLTVATDHRLGDSVQIEASLHDVALIVEEATERALGMLRLIADQFTDTKDTLSPIGHDAIFWTLRAAENELLDIRALVFASTAFSQAHDRERGGA